MSQEKRNVIMLLLAAVMVAGFFYFNTADEKKVGLYRYIKKAHKYIDEEKYEKAIFLLHKAYEELPASDDIRNHLISGYVKYGRYLDKEGDDDRAIEYLTMAYEMDEVSLTVRHDLAYLYSKKAVLESKQKKYGPALENMYRSIEISTGSKKISKSISNYLFNSGVEAYNEKDGKTLLFCLHSSYVLRPRFGTLDFLGQYYYGKSNFEKALFYWEKASSLRSSDKNIGKKIDKAKAEISLIKRRQSVKTPHFILQLYKNYVVDKDLLKRLLGKLYNEVGQELGYYPPTNTVIIFYNEKDFRNIFKLQGIVRAFYDGSIRMVFSPGLGGRDAAGIIAHEYTHAIVSMATDNRSPIWLNEGLAVRAQEQYMPINLEHLENFIDSGKKLSLEKLEVGFSLLDDPHIVALSYEGAYTVVSFIVEKWGLVGLKGLLQRIKNGRHFANAIDEEFYVSVNMFEDMWNEYLRKKFSGE